MTLGRAIVVCGTSSDVGKSRIVAGLCRAFCQKGISVAPFKGQNMALNSVVTAGGAEIGRAQYVQALAAKAEPEAAMNPVLLKPTATLSSQVVVMGKSIGNKDARSYQEQKAELVPIVDGALADLRRRFDLVICEGAGSPAEINLLDYDLVNLGMAKRAQISALLVGDIDRGGVFASFFGTVSILPNELAARVGGFIVNKFRGDSELLTTAFKELEKKSGVRTLGMIPYLPDIDLDAEDSLALGPVFQSADNLASLPLDLERAQGNSASIDVLDIAVVRFPRISNFTDFDPLRIEPRVRLRYATSVRELVGADLVVLPGTKSTMADLKWLEETGISLWLKDSLSESNQKKRPFVLGICGGYQMLGTRILDAHGVESDQGMRRGLGLLEIETEFRKEKVTMRRSGAQGYEIHHGRILVQKSAPRWNTFDGEPEGICEAGVFGTSVHGWLETDAKRRDFLETVATFRGLSRFEAGRASFGKARESQIDRLADACIQYLDLDAIFELAGSTC